MPSGTLGVWLALAQGTIAAVSTLVQILAILGLLILIALRFGVGREAIARVWLSWGKIHDWVLFFALQVAFNVIILRKIVGMDNLCTSHIHVTRLERASLA